MDSLEKVNKPIPDGQFNVIYADPPWQYDFCCTDSRKIENHYPTMSAEEIAKIKFTTADDAVLFLWATAPKLREALYVMESWGFTYKTHAVWDKEIIGMGYWFRSQHELLLIGTKGNMNPPEPEKRYPSIIKSKRTEPGYSEKIYHHWLLMLNIEVSVPFKGGGKMMPVLKQLLSIQEIPFPHGMINID